MKRITITLLPLLMSTGCLLAPNAYYEPSGPEGVLRQTLTACETFGPAQNLVVALQPSLDLVVSAEPFNYASDTLNYGATLSFMFLSGEAITVTDTSALALIDGAEVPLDLIEDRDLSSRTSIGPVLPETTTNRRIRLYGEPIREGAFSQIVLTYGVPGETPQEFEVTPPTVQAGKELVASPPIKLEKKSKITSYSLNC
ncbi:MAG: hypothetical protein AAFO74_06125 [Pseudomonadota bacterium]